MRRWLTRWRQWWPEGPAGREIWQNLVFSRIALVAVGWVALAELPWQYISPTYNPSTNPLVLMWIRWDALWYTGIAQHGYWMQALAFFPLYPLLIAAFHAAFRLSFNVAALVVSNVCLVLFQVTFYRLVRAYFPERVARRAVLFSLLFPTAFYLSGAYTEALFMWLSTAAFLAARERRFWAVGVYGCLATLTRNEGAFLVIPFLWAYYQEHRWRITRDLVPLTLLPLAMLAFMAYQWRDFGNPLAFLAAQSYWGRQLSLPWRGIWLALGAIWQGGPLQASAVLSMIDLIAAVSSAVLWVYGLRKRFPPDWLVYWGVLWLVDVSAPVPSGQSPLLSMSRLVLVLFPSFVALSLIARNPGWRRLLTWTLTMLQALFFVIFTTWHWIA
jgi:hypothetical protein